MTDYAGKTCGVLYVVREIPDMRINRERAWECKCTVCGAMYKKSTSQLRTAKHGCPICARISLHKGERYGSLTAVKFVEHRKTAGAKVSIWRFRCDCGNEIDAAATLVKCGSITSCGCKRAERAREAGKDAAQKSGQLVENTYLARLKDNSVPKNNTSGYRGVYFNSRRQKYVAQIYFKGKQIIIGAFDDPAEASEAYQVAKEELHGGLLEKYGIKMDEQKK